MKGSKHRKTDYIDKHYSEHRGILVKKYRSFFGKYVFVMDENGVPSKVYVGRCIYEDAKIGSKLTVGEINHKLVNIRPGICINNEK